MNKRNVDWLPWAAVCLLCLASTLRADDRFGKISVRGDRLYAGNEELLLVAVAYTHDVPGQDYGNPVAHPEHGYDLIDLDMQRIKEAGFNAIRTWSLLDEKVLELAQKHGLWVIGGIRTQRAIDVKNEMLTKDAVFTVSNQARIYSRYPNTAMLLLLNEPEIVPIARTGYESLKSYFDRLVRAAKESCPGIPVSFSNWPNAGFIDSDSWDVVGFNVYANSTLKFQNALGYRGYIDAIRRKKAGGKPFFLTEYGFYSPVPRLNPNDAFRYHHVPSESKQAEFLVRDMETLYQSPLIGGALMEWKDNWWLSQDLFSPGLNKKEKKEGYVNKDVHDMECIEWCGLVSMDQDIKGIPRPALRAVAAANHAILTQPDSESIYSGKIPVAAHLSDQVAEVELIADGRSLGTFPRAGSHWFRREIPAPGKDLERHEIVLRAFDAEKKLLRDVKRSVWTAEKTAVPSLSIAWKKDDQNRIFFTFTLQDENGQPIKDARIAWGALDSAIWTEAEGVVKTDKKGVAELRRPLPSNTLVVCGGYDYQRKDFRKKITDICFFRQ